LFDIGRTVSASHKYDFSMPNPITSFLRGIHSAPLVATPGLLERAFTLCESRPDYFGCYAWPGGGRWQISGSTKGLRIRMFETEREGKTSYTVEVSRAGTPDTPAKFELSSPASIERASRLFDLSRQALYEIG
jgi:hypothetical protein